MAPITKYQDYRQFLNDFAIEKRSQSRQWSLGSWKRHLGISSTATLSMILTGRRHPGKALTKSFSKYFSFSENEAKYFARLVELQKRSESSRMALVLTAAPDSLPSREQPVDTQQISPELQSLLLNPLTHILREMTSLDKVEHNPEWLQKNISSKHSKESIAAILHKLVDNALLTHDQGVLRAINSHFHAGPPTKDKILRFHETILEETKKSLPHLKEEDRSFHVSYLNVRRENLAIAKKLLREFQSEFNKLVEEKPGDEVYQLSMQFIPVTCVNKDRSHKM